MASPDGGEHGPEAQAPRIVARIVAASFTQQETTLFREVPGGGDAGDEDAEGDACAEPPGASEGDEGGAPGDDAGDEGEIALEHEPDDGGSDTTNGSRVASSSMSIRG